MTAQKNADDVSLKLDSPSVEAVSDLFVDVSEDSATLLDVKANDDDGLGGGPSSVSLNWVGPVTPYGTVAISGSQVLFSPENCAAPYTSTFEYDIAGMPDGNYDSDSALVTVMVAADNDAPVMQNTNIPLVEDNGSSGNLSSLCINPEPDDVLTFGASGEGIGYFWPESDGSYSYWAENHHESYTDTYTIVVTDTAGLTGTAALSFVVTASNSPVNDGVLGYDLTEDGHQSGSFWPTTSESKEPLELQIVQAPAYGRASAYGIGPWYWSYRPDNRSQSYTDTLVIRVTDTLPSSAELTVVFTVTADNELPVVDHFPTLSDAHVGVSYNFLFSLRDRDQDQTLVPDILAIPDWLSLSSHINDSYQYEGTPGPSDVGPCELSLRAFDGTVYSAVSTGYFDVRPRFDVAYVDGTKGTDSNYYGGSPNSAAFRTISYALERVTYGGTVLIAPGIYTEGLWLPMTVSLAPSHEGGDGSHRVMLDGSSAEYGIGIMLGDANISMIGLDIINTTRGVGSYSNAANTSISWCNFENAGEYGYAANHSTPMADLRHNWWGSADGPSGAGPGSGAAVTDNALYTPWLRSRLLGQRQATLDGQATLDAEDSADLSATISTTAPVTLTLAQYDQNPQASFMYETNAFWDVQLDDPGSVDELVVRFYLSDESLADKNIWLSSIMFWDAEADPPAWVPCSQQEPYRPSYSLPYEAIDVTFNSETTPSLSQLTGTEFGFLGMPKLSMTRSGGPVRFGPGWNLTFDWVISNTADIPLHNVIITDIVPTFHNWYDISGDLGEPEVIPASFGAYHIYRLPELASGDVLRQHLVYHTPSTLPDGKVFLYEAYATCYEGLDASVSIGLHCDHGLNEPTPAPTPTAAPAFGAYLPVVLKE